ncbi:unnamed protein product [Paramecium pentaurelia]|uniref:Uncharacterized protein n=1 Tax=Paramecium pentaurelia TaxID=43138 RepID=A0A8S1TW72_9CILI|nr:unnamed protein product [Paramecium pentaurelia]
MVFLLAFTLGGSNLWVNLAQQYISLGSNLKLHSLSELHNLKTTQLECGQILREVSTSIDVWLEILEKQDQLNMDSNNLQKLKLSLQIFRENGYNDVEPVLSQFRNIFTKIMGQISAQNLRNTPFQRWRKDSVMELQGVVSTLNTVGNKKDLELSSDKIEELINSLMQEREQIRNQCQKGSQNTIKIIANKVKQITNECSDSLQIIARIKPNDDEGQVVITGKPDGQQQVKGEIKQPIHPTQPIKLQPAYRVLQASTDEGDGEDFLNQLQLSEFTNQTPVYQKERNKPEPFTEYGYGYWAKFQLAYPQFLPSGKNEIWYFVSRLSANQNDQDITMGDRLLAIWLGKGYYLFTTCDQPSDEPNNHQIVNYPEDFDGIWTYIYYSYSVEKKKAVAFIKFGSGDLIKVIHQVSNPSTNWVRFTISGKDQNRYPGFNGSFQQIYFSTNQGVFLDSENCDISKLQENTQPNDFLLESITYTLVSNLQQRNADTVEVFSIVGTSDNPQYPHEYTFSGWFKWEVPEQQQEWHKIFRVQIKEPSTDGQLGYRTLAAWVGEGDGGIIHLATYTYTNLEGGGNPNVVQNIQHQNRHTEWFFISFGYSRPQKKAVASIQWKESTDKKEYNNIRHFHVPKFFIYVGKDKMYPGFNGKIALASFIIGGLQMVKIVDFQPFIPGCSNFINGLCFNCFEGWNYLDLINQCVPICGDKIIKGNEECDDGNIIPFDGCFNCKFQCAKNCQICRFGKCIQCLIGYKLKSQYCYPICGDNLTLDSEQCDDGNNEKFDGCYKCEYSCQIECQLCVNQQCFQCLEGWQLISNKCEQVCNDNMLAILSIEQCDNDDDMYCNGCISLCQDNCLSCLEYNECQFCRNPFQLVNGVCTSICGDSIVTVGFEQCDDGNDIKYDGCYQCQLQCSFGCIQCQNNNICTQCDPKFTELNISTMKCEQIKVEIEINEEILEDNDNQCGNGLLNSLYEDCDDGNIAGGDGCSAYCNIEESFICENVEGSISICTYLEAPKFKLKSLSDKKSQSQILELSFSQKVKLSTDIAFENITIFTVLPTIRYDINIIPLVKCSTEFNQSKYQISIFFRDPVKNPVLKVEIEKSMIINELNQYLMDNTLEINLGNPFVISEATQQTVTKIVSMNDAMIYSMISISGLVLLTGNTIMFLNLLDLLQSLSYLRYMQYQFPQHLKQFLDTYTKISLQPILDFLQIDLILQKLNGGTLPFKKKEVQIQLNTYFLMNSKSCYFSILLSLFSYCVFCLITSSKMLYWLQCLEQRFWENSKYLRFQSFIQQKIIRKCLRLKIKYLSFGIFQMYYSILHQLIFSALLQFPNYTFDSAFNIFNSINAIIALLFILFSTIKLFSITTNNIKDVRKWKYFFNEKINGFWTKNYKSFQICRVIFYIFNIVAFIDYPELQSILLSMSSAIYLIYLIQNNPLRSQYDFIKLIFKETFLLIITGSFLIYSFNLSNELLLLCGWIHIALFSTMLASSLVIDMINHLINAYNHYQNLKYQNEIKKIQEYFHNRLQRFILNDPENLFVQNNKLKK